MSQRWIEDRCPRCGYNLMSTQQPGYAYCNSCRAYYPSRSPQAGQRWHGFFMPELCKFCGQPIVDTTDPKINFCPSCRRYQPDRLGY